ncbi:hypothetical protein TNCV_1194771 [Trichonephila clavipes]|nr:hypothetical protein TNCV_1194771 [Trichonephila clavipes]
MRRYARSGAGTVSYMPPPLGRSPRFLILVDMASTTTGPKGQILPSNSLPNSPSPNDSRPNDPKLQSYHQEVTKAGESVELLLCQAKRSSFSNPCLRERTEIRSFSALKIGLATAEKNEEGGRQGFLLPHLTRSRVERRNEASMLTASLPPSNLLEKVRSPRSTPSLANPSSAPILDSATLEEQGEEGMDTNIDVPLSQEEVPVATKKPRIPPFLRLAQG